MMPGKDKNGIPYKNTVDVGRIIIHDEGARTLLSGIEPRFTWISIFFRLADSLSLALTKNSGL